MKKAIITGVNGQDGSYLAELLLDKGYEVHGTIRRSSSFNTWRIDHIRSHENFHWHYADVTDPVSISNLISRIKPEEFYNLAPATVHKKTLTFSSGFVTSKEVRFSELTNFVNIDGNYDEIDGLTLQTRLPANTVYTTRASISQLNTFANSTSDFYLKVSATFDPLYFGQSDVNITFNKHTI